MFAEGVMEVTALGKKLFLSQLVRVFIDLNFHPEGRGTNSLIKIRQIPPRWVVSEAMLLAFF